MEAFCEITHQPNEYIKTDQRNKKNQRKIAKTIIYEAHPVVAIFCNKYRDITIR